MPSKLEDDIIYAFGNFNGYTADIWEWISNFILYFIMDIIYYPCWDDS